MTKEGKCKNKIRIAYASGLYTRRNKSVKFKKKSLS